MVKGFETTGTRIFIVALCLILGMYIGVQTFYSCSTITVDEGFDMMKDIANVVQKHAGKSEPTSEGLSAEDSLPPNTQAEADHLKRDYKSTPMPMADGKLDFFGETTFSPNCCPSTYTSSSGCACLSKDQMTHLKTRGSSE